MLRENRKLVIDKFHKSDYVMHEADITRILYSDVLKLSIEGKKTPINIRGNIINIGDGESNDIVIACGSKEENSTHASFLYEFENTWFLRDNYSKEGTWLNGVKLIPGKKYELMVNDSIDFAHVSKAIFYPPAINQFLVNYSEFINEQLVGMRIHDKYKVLDLLKKNFYSKVYLVKDERANKIYEMYVFGNKDNLKVSGIIDFCVDMYRSNLEHCLIPQIKEIYEDKENIYFIREYVTGDTLRVFICNNGAQNTEVVVKWGKELCEAFILMHSLNKDDIYFALNANNVYVVEGNVLKLQQFEIIKRKPEIDDYLCCIMHSDGYAAPEEFGGIYELDERTIVYRIGVLMHIMITESDPTEPPYELLPIREINPDLPKRLEKIISKCIQRNPAERYQSCQELLKDLINYQNRSKGILRWIKNII